MRCSAASHTVAGAVGISTPNSVRGTGPTSQPSVRDGEAADVAAPSLHASESGQEAEEEEGTAYCIPNIARQAERSAEGTGESSPELAKRLAICIVGALWR